MATKSDALKIRFHLATKGRPHAMLNCIYSLMSNVENEKNYFITIAADRNDRTTYNKKTLQEIAPLIKEGKIIIDFGEPQGKVAAMNRVGLSNKKWDILVSLTDSVEFNRFGFDTLIRNRFFESPAPMCVMWAASNNNGDETFYLKTINRKLYDKYGYIYNPDLKANFYEEEFVRRVKPASDEANFFNYKHPKWFYEQPDAAMTENIMKWKDDLLTFESLPCQ